MEFAMTKLMRAFLVAMIFVAPLAAAAQQDSSTKDASIARSKEGKKLFGSADALRVARVSSPRISPDGSRVAYLNRSMPHARSCRQTPMPCRAATRVLSRRLESRSPRG